MKKIYKVGVVVMAMFVLTGGVSWAKGKGLAFRGEITGVVEDLRVLAERDKSIGQEISEIAKEQEEMASKSAEAIDKVEGRGLWKVILFGSDYENLGVLRSQLVTTRSHINRLTRAMERSTSSTVKTELQLQIDVLEANVDKIEKFIKENENRFGILGWVKKMFN